MEKTTITGWYISPKRPMKKSEYEKTPMAKAISNIYSEYVHDKKEIQHNELLQKQPSQKE